MIYASLILLAIALALLHRSHFFTAVYNQYLSLTQWPGLHPYVVAMADVYVRFGFHLAVFRMFISTAICILYVYVTYVGHIDEKLLIVQRVVAITLLIQFIFKLLVSVRPISFIFGGESIMEVLSLSCLLMSKRSDWLTFSFLQAYIILSRYFTIEPTLEAIFMPKSSPFHRQLTRLTLEFIVFIYVFACGLQLFERLGEPWETLTGTTFELTIANSFYFTVVTIFTVGYGDFVPFTLLGRLWIIFVIVFGAYLVSRKIGQVVDVLSGLRRGLGSFVKAEGVDHCVVCGNVKWEYLKSFVQEFYGDERNISKKLVVICDKPNWSEETWNKFFTSHAQFKNNVTYLEGSCVSRDDLLRAQMETANAVFVLNNQHNSDPYAEDSETLKRILTIRSYTPQLPIYSMCALRDSLPQISYALEHQDESEAEHDGGSRQVSMNALKTEFIAASPTDENPAVRLTDFSDELDDEDGLVVPGYDGTSDLKSEAICMQEVEMSILAENVFCNGLSTLLANLILQVHPVSKPTDPRWGIEYKIGSECRFEYVKMPLRLHDKKYSDLALIMYDYGVLLIATKRFMDSKWKAVTPDTVINLNTIGLVITYHSTRFLDYIMDDVANRMQPYLDETDSRTSQDVPSSFEDEFKSGRDVPRHSFAGDRLTGDLSVIYESGDEYPPEPPFHASTYPAATMGPSFADEGDRLTSFDNDHGKYPLVNPERPLRTQSSVPENALRSALYPGPSEQTTNPLIYARTDSESVGVADTLDPRTNTGFLSFRDVDATQAQRESPLASALDTVQDSKVPLFREGRSLASPSHGNPPVASVTSAESSEGMDSDIPSTSMNAAQPAPVETVLEDQEVAELAKALQEGLEQEESVEVAKIIVRTSPPRTGDDFREPEGNKSVESKAVAAPRHNRGRYHVSFPNQTHVASKGMSRLSSKGSASSSRPSRRHSRDRSYLEDEHLQILLGEDELPIKVKGHIVVCTIGQMGVRNLKHFLQRVWVKRGLSSKKEFDGKTTVVAICLRLTEEDEAELSVFPRDQLFVIQGNSLSVKTLKRAQYDQARAIIILACEDKDDADHMDAKAIFTVMTLDYLLGEKSDTFVCTMLDAEESMQLLRAPSHARRRETMLGRAGEEFVQYEIYSERSKSASRRNTLGSPGSYATALKRLRSGSLRRRHTGRNQSLGGRALSFGAASIAGIPGLPQSMSFVGLRNTTYSDRREAIGRLVVRDRNVFESLQQIPTQTSFGAFRSRMEEEDEHLMNDPLMGGPSALNFLWNPSTYTVGAGPGLLPGEAGYGRMRGLIGGYSRPRDESFEKQRYASGEMMISSTYTALLIREYAMPGLMAVVRKIFGAGVGKNPRPKRCWIRTINVPQLWMQAAPEGRRTYRELFELLIGHGAVALGLYRSGDAPVRVELRPDDEYDSDEENSIPHSGYGEGSYQYSGRSESARQGSFDVAGFSSDGSEGMGSHNRGDGPSEQAEETTSLLQKQPSYGTVMDRRRNQNRQHRRGQAGVEDDGAQLDIPAGLWFDMAEDVHTAQQGTEPPPEEEEEPPVDEFEYDTYTCPTHGRKAIFREERGGDNVLPYVYTNPEPYTLISEHDAVYVLVPPAHTLPEPDEW